VAGQFGDDLHRSPSASISGAAVRRVAHVRIRRTLARVIASSNHFEIMSA
jgi:hypothetical protein